jgi:pimeloyl-ACP methyl ester carboxylesterase
MMIVRAVAGFLLLSAFATAQAQTVHLPSDPGVALAATLRLPAGAGPFPLVLLLSGSGASRRGVFSLLADRLVAQGIATFEYDKRGVGESTGTFLDTIALNQRDGEAAVAWLRDRPGIDGRRIAVLGMSQGGVVAPAIAARDPEVAAVVMLAGPVGRRSEPFMTGLHARLAEAGHGEAVIERIAQAVRQWMAARSRAAGAAGIGQLRAAAVDVFRATGATPQQAEGMVAVLDTPQLLSMYEAGSFEELARIDAPVLALFAEKDDVLSAASIPAARAALARKRDAAVIEVKGVNHSRAGRVGAGGAGDCCGLAGRALAALTRHSREGGNP